MKISRITLNSYNQFKDITIDLTYPKGHKKQGQPLDKVCFIGQSGTGKTSLLRLIKWFVSGDRRIDEVIELPPLPTGSVEMEFQFADLKFKLYSSEKPPYLRPIFPGGDTPEVSHRLIRYLQETSPLLINFPTEIISNRYFKEVEPYKPGESAGDNELKKDVHPFGISPQIVDFAFHEPKISWEYALKDIIDYRANRLKRSLEISDIKSKQEGSTGENGEKDREYQEWLDTHPDPVKTLAEQCLDKILEKVGLKVKVDIDIPSIRNLGYIQLQALDGTVVPGEFWSTGTGNIVMTVLPLFQVKPRNAVILIDEPEHSLYPDIQLEIVDLYTKQTRECQFFFATHSPVIASVFEPWEIVELKFDREHRKATLNRFHEGENDVANYRYYPQYLRWDLILQDIFKMEEEGGEKRIDALNKFAELNVRIRKLKMNNRLDTPEGQNLIEEARVIGEKLRWRTDFNRK
jgi:hypothetical protein